MDNSVFTHVLLDQAEDRWNGRGSHQFCYDAQAWSGTDLNKLWIKSEGLLGSRGRFTDGQQELLYDRAVSTFFDVQAGVRVDLDNGPTRTWAALGVQGLSLYFFDLEATAAAAPGPASPTSMPASACATRSPASSPPISASPTRAASARLAAWRRQPTKSQAASASPSVSEAGSRASAGSSVPDQQYVGACRRTADRSARCNKDSRGPKRLFAARANFWFGTLEHHPTKRDHPSDKDARKTKAGA